MSFEQNWEDNIYSKNAHINSYPYGELVSIFFNSLKFMDSKKLADKGSIKILELGCGSGNNLWFISELGFDTYGVDGSKTACEIALKKSKERNTKVKIECATFEKLPFENESIDIIIDRESTYCGILEDIKQWWSEANRVLKKDGLVISFKFSEDSPDLHKIKSGVIKADKLENNTYTNISSGSFMDSGISHFSTYDELFDIFDFCDIKFINKHTSNTVYDSVGNQFNYDEYIVVGIKK